MQWGEVKLIRRRCPLQRGCRADRPGLTNVSWLLRELKLFREMLSGVAAKVSAFWLLRTDRVRNSGHENANARKGSRRKVESVGLGSDEYGYNEAATSEATNENFGLGVGGVVGLCLGRRCEFGCRAGGGCGFGCRFSDGALPAWSGGFGEWARFGGGAGDVAPRRECD